MSQGTLSNSRTARAVRASPVQVGEIVAGKYRVEKILAAGGMGVVVSARHEVLKQSVAIKFLIPEAMDPQTIARFLREAKAAARIQSERVVRVYDCGTLPTGVPYMVMEHLEGIDLAQHIRTGGAMPSDEAVDLVCSALEGVADAHALGIVHRDLKPANLFLVGAARRPYSVKVLDFGISKIQAGADAPVEDDLTGTAMMLGSPRYVSPEQARNSSDVDVRADVWSIGVILYELLDGRCPFSGDTIGEVLSKILLHDPPPMDEKREDVPKGLGAVLRGCLERNAAERYSTVVDLARALAPYGSELARFHLQRIERVFDLPHAPAAAISRPNLPEPVAREAFTRVADTGAGAERPSGLAAEPGEPSDSSTQPSVGEGTDASVPGQRTEGTWTQGRRGDKRSRAWIGLAALTAAAVVGAAVRWFVVDPGGPASQATSFPTGSVRESASSTASGAPSGSVSSAVPSAADADIGAGGLGALPMNGDGGTSPDAAGSATTEPRGPSRPSGTSPRTTAATPAAPPARHPPPKATSTPKSVLDRSD